MLGNILGIILLFFLVLFVIGSCIAASQSDEEFERYLMEDKENEKKNV